MKRASRLIISLIACHLAGIIGSIFTAASIPSWYSTINKPTFTPPNWLFGPVWLILYTMMGISLFLVWERKFNDDRNTILVFCIQLIFNALWSIIFFGLKAPFFAFIVILLLWISILLTILKFSKVSKKAAVLLVPYILWVSFAALLNFSIWRIN